MTTRFYIRMAQSPGVWQSDKIDQLIEDFRDEFGGVDCKLSIYKSGNYSLIQLSSEFSCAVRHYKKPVDWLDITPFLPGVDPIENPGRSEFAVLRDYHCELCTEEPVIVQMVDKIGIAIKEGVAKLERVKASEIIEYATDKIKSNDMEWLSWKESKENREPDCEWLKAINKKLN